MSRSNVRAFRSAANSRCAHFDNGRLLIVTAGFDRRSCRRLGQRSKFLDRNKTRTLLRLEEPRSGR